MTPAALALAALAAALALGPVLTLAGLIAPAVAHIISILRKR